jgi:nitrogen regulatory protein PII
MITPPLTSVFPANSYYKYFINTWHRFCVRGGRRQKPERLCHIKKIEAIIRPLRIEEVRDALAELGIDDLTLTEVRGFGRQHGRTEIYLGGEYSLDFIPKAKIELVVPDAHLDAAITAVARGARTGKIGDGKIFVSHIEQAGLIRRDPATARA